MLESKLFCRR